MTFQQILLCILHYILALKRALVILLLRLKPLSSPHKKQTVCRFLHDSRGLKKLPIHMGIVIVENEISYTDIANIIVWSIAMGVYYISLYDRSGNLKRNGERISSEFRKQQTVLLGAGNSKFDIEIFKSRSYKSRQVNGYSKNKADIILLSSEDGRHSIVDTARGLCRAVSSKQFKLEDISPSHLEDLFLEKQGFPDPDLVLKFGQVDSLLGYLPWQTRLTEILAVPSLRSFSYESFVMALSAFGDTQQRFGK